MLLFVLILMLSAGEVTSQYGYVFTVGGSRVDGMTWVRSVSGNTVHQDVVYGGSHNQGGLQVSYGVCRGITEGDPVPGKGQYTDSSGQLDRCYVEHFGSQGLINFDLLVDASLPKVTAKVKAESYSKSQYNTVRTVGGRTVQKLTWQSTGVDANVDPNTIFGGRHDVFGYGICRATVDGDEMTGKAQYWAQSNTFERCYIENYGSVVVTVFDVLVWV